MCNSCDGLNKQKENASVHAYIHVVKRKGMPVPLKIFASEVLLAHMKKDICIEQGVHMAHLPGAVGHVLMMPDAHQGYGFPIGGVAAFHKENGLLSPGGVGFDINCGMRALVVNLSYEQIKEKLDTLLDDIYAHIPVGMGQDSLLRLTHEELEEVMTTGASWAVKKGLGVARDLMYIEEQGCMPGADPTKVSIKARKRGRLQIGTLGAGNHFIEIQRVAKIYDKQVADVFGCLHEDQVVVMIHSGSRGLGHQICTDYLRRIEEEFPDIMNTLEEKDLAYAPISSDVAQDYYKAMCCAMNFAWTNRQVMAHRIREAFIRTYGDNTRVDLIYDMSHNNAKLETHLVDGKQQEVWVHRKGAARAFGPHHNDIPQAYKEVGQPVLIPGSMGTASYILAGTQEAMLQTFGSTCHGAGRVMSRKKAYEQFHLEEVEEHMQRHNIKMRVGSKKAIIDESPGVYKDIHEIIRVCDETGIAKPIVQLQPIGVIKG